jgi:hypothetical protein
MQTVFTTYQLLQFVKLMMASNGILIESLYSNIDCIALRKLNLLIIKAPLKNSLNSLLSHLLIHVPYV